MRNSPVMPGQTATFAIRPEQLSLAAKTRVARKDLASGAGEGLNAVTGIVALTSYLGACIDVHAVLAGGERLILSMANRTGLAVPAVGDSVEITWPENGGMIFARDM